MAAVAPTARAQARLCPWVLGASLLLGLPPSWAAAPWPPGSAASGLPAMAPLWQPSDRPAAGVLLWSTRPFASPIAPVWTSPNPVPLKGGPLWSPR
jgi:hypothetical protein